MSFFVWDPGQNFRRLRVTNYFDGRIILTNYFDGLTDFSSITYILKLITCSFRVKVFTNCSDF